MPEPDQSYDVLCYGTISMDNITRLPYLPNPRRDVQAMAEYNTVGGEALDVAIPLATWGMRVLVMGNVIGTDWKGDFILNELARFPNIDTRYLVQNANVTTPFTRILVTPDGDRSRIGYWFERTPKVELTSSVMRQAALLSVDAYGRDERDRAAQVARYLGCPIITADAFWPQYPLAGLSDVIIISRARLQAHFPGVFDYDHGLELQGLGAGTIIITDGDRPVLVVRSDGSAFGVEPYTIPRVVDTSGAGHLFKAGMIYAWQQPHWPLEQKVMFACASAALSCRQERPRAQPPTLAEIHELMSAQPR
jgi:sugar/nucleoside kinase (ribokinase family)